MVLTTYVGKFAQASPPLCWVLNTRLDELISGTADVQLIDGRAAETSGLWARTNLHRYCLWM